MVFEDIIQANGYLRRLEKVKALKRAMQVKAHEGHGDHLGDCLTQEKKKLGQNVITGRVLLQSIKECCAPAGKKKGGRSMSTTNKQTSRLAQMNIFDDYFEANVKKPATMGLNPWLM